MFGIRIRVVAAWVSLTALALPCYMRHAAPIATVAPGSNRDAMAYGPPPALPTAYRPASGPGDTVLVGERWF